MNKKIVVLCFMIALIPSLFIVRGLYVTSDYHILKCNWKSGFSNVTFGDVLVFNESYRLNHGNITMDGQPIARIIIREYRPYAANILVIESIEPSALALFYEKGCD